LEARQPTQELYDISKMLDDKDREIERLKLKIEEFHQDKLIIKKEEENDIVVILPTNLLSEMFRASREEEERGGEIKQFYLKAKDGIVIDYETDFRRSKDNNETTTTIIRR
jgi:hypothetical protein